MADPHIMADRDARLLPLVAKCRINALPQEIFVRPVGDLMLAHPLDRVLKRIDARARCDGAELADPRIDDLGMAFDIAVVAKLRLGERHALADFAETAKLRLAQSGTWVDDRVAAARRARRVALGGLAAQAAFAASRRFEIDFLSFRALAESVSGRALLKNLSRPPACSTDLSAMALMRK